MRPRAVIAFAALFAVGCAPREDHPTIVVANHSSAPIQLVMPLYGTSPVISANSTAKAFDKVNVLSGITFVISDSRTGKTLLKQELTDDYVTMRLKEDGSKLQLEYPLQLR